MSEKVYRKLEHVNCLLSERGSALVACSGGADRTFPLVAAEAHRHLEPQAFAVTLVSEFHPREEFEQARRQPEQLGARLLVLEADPLSFGACTG